MVGNPYETTIVIFSGGYVVDDSWVVDAHGVLMVLTAMFLHSSSWEDNDPFNDDQDEE